MKILIGGEKSKAPQHVDNATNADIPEKILRSFCSSLACFVNFRGGYRLRKGKFRIFDHHPAHQRNEEHTQDATHHDERC